MMDFLPIARIVLRYGVGYVLGAELGEALALDPDVVLTVAIGIAAAIEVGYSIAKRRGGAT